MKLKITISFVDAEFYVKSGTCVIEIIPLPNDEIGMTELNGKLESFVKNCEVSSYLNPEQDNRVNEKLVESTKSVHSITAKLKEEVLKVITRMDLNKSNKEVGFINAYPVSVTIKLVADNVPSETVPMHSF